MQTPKELREEAARLRAMADHYEMLARLAEGSARVSPSQPTTVERRRHDNQSSRDVFAYLEKVGAASAQEIATQVEVSLPTVYAVFKRDEHKYQKRQDGRWSLVQGAQPSPAREVKSTRLRTSKDPQWVQQIVPGMAFGKLTVLRRAPADFGKTNDFWECECDCGNMKSVRAPHLKQGSTTSCGCARKRRSSK